MIPVGGKKSRRARVAGGTIDNAVIGGTTAAAATVTTLTATGQTSLGGAAGAEALRAVVTASAVNYAQVAGGIATAPISITATGTDTNIALSLIAKGTAGVIQTGTSTNDSAAAGKIGEFITSTVAVGNVVTLSNATGKTVTSISLTAGDWDVSGLIEFVLAGATSTLHQAAISLTADTLSAQPGGSGLGTDPLVNMPLPTTTLSGTLSLPITPVRCSFSATTTVYLVAQSAFAVGGETAYGTIRARRMR